MDTQTTLPFGFTNESLSAELLKAEEASLCLQPLTEHLFQSPFVELDNSSLANEVMVWIEKRGACEVPSFEEVDPKLGPMARYIWGLILDKAMIQEELCQACKLKEETILNVEKASKAMVQKQRDLMYAAGHANPEQVGLFKVRVQNVECWRLKKIDDAQVKVAELLELSQSKATEIESSVDELVQKAKGLQAEISKAVMDDHQCDVFMQELDGLLAGECEMAELKGIQEIGEKGQDENSQPMANDENSPQVAMEGVTTVQTAEEANDKEQNPLTVAVTPGATQMAEQTGEVAIDSATQKAEQTEVAKDGATQNAEQTGDTQMAEQTEVAKNGATQMAEQTGEVANDSATQNAEQTGEVAKDGATQMAEQTGEVAMDGATQKTETPEVANDSATTSEVVQNGATQMAEQPKENSAPSAPVATPCRATPSGSLALVANAMQRKDTMQLASEMDEEQGVPQEDGTMLYAGPNGRWETWDQRQKRLQHNLKMCFHRSLESNLLAYR